LNKENTISISSILSIELLNSVHKKLNTYKNLTLKGGEDMATKKPKCPECGKECEFLYSCRIKGKTSRVLRCPFCVKEKGYKILGIVSPPGNKLYNQKN